MSEDTAEAPRGPGRPRKAETLLVGVIAPSFGWNGEKYTRGQTFEMAMADMVRFPRQVMMAEAAATYIEQENAAND